MKKLILLWVISMSHAYSQSSILQSYIDEGLESNLALKQQNLEIEKSVKAISIAKANLFPKIAFAPTYTMAAGGRSIEFPIGDLLNPVYNSLNKLTQSNEFQNLENQNILFAPNNFHETKFTFQLPLFNSDIKYNILLQKDLVQTEEAKKKMLQYELKYSIETAYYQYLLSLEALKIYRQSEGFLKDFLDFNQRLVNNDLALKDVIYSTRYEIDKLNGETSEAEKNSKTAKAYFNFLINKPLERPIEVDSSMFIILPSSSSLDELKNISLNSRPELFQLNAGQNANKTLLLMQEKNAKLPSFFIGGSSGFQGYGYKFNNQAFAVGQVGLTWDLFHGYEKKYKIEQTKIQTEILTTKEEEVKNQILMQVTQAYFDYRASLEKLNSAQSGLHNTVALQGILEKRYKNKDALYIEVLRVQNDHLLAELNASLAKFNVWLKKAHLDKVSAR